MATLFVGNLSPDVDENDLRALFGAYGTVNAIRLITRRGLAYVELDPAAADAAIEALRGEQLKGRTLDVALENRPAGGRPGKRRGRGRR